MDDDSEMYRRPRLADVREVISRIEKNKRAQKISPLLEWLLEKQQKEKNDPEKNNVP